MLAYASSYVVGAVISYLLLRHRLGGLRSRRLLVFAGRLVIATGLATALTFPVAQVLDGLAEDPGTLVAAVRLVCVGAVDVLLFLVLARLLRINEVNHVLATLTGRTRSRWLPSPGPSLLTAERAVSKRLRWAPRGAHQPQEPGGGKAACRTRPGPATCSPTGTGWSTCSARAGAAGSGAPTTGSSSGTSRCT